VENTGFTATMGGSTKAENAMLMPTYSAPEVLRAAGGGDCNINYFFSDKYSFGVVLWEVATRQKPWTNYTAMDILRAVGNLNETLVMPPDSSATMLSIFKACCDAKPANRYAQSQPFSSDTSYASDFACCIGFYDIASSS